MSNKVFIATDHGALDAKDELVSYLKDRIEVVDLGTFDRSSCHYPSYAITLAKSVLEHKARGILLCGSGIGVSIVANRFAGIRAALCRTVEEVELSRQHNDANVLCLGGRISTIQDMKEMVDAFFETKFEGGRHSERLALFDSLGEK